MKKMKNLCLILLLVSTSFHVMADALDNLRQTGFGDLFGGDSGTASDVYDDTPVTADSSSTASVSLSLIHI